LRSIIAWQTLTLLLVGLAVGVPLGVVTGRWAWTAFASSLGVVPVTVIPVTPLVVGLVVLVFAGTLMTSIPRSSSSGISTASSLRAE
jgi:ABC-type dipeptide/oligopeptide/nickel transport system permease component